MSNEDAPHEPDHRPAVGVPVERMVRLGAEARQELTASLDKSGSVVLIDGDGDILFYAADGKMKVERLGPRDEVVPSFGVLPDPASVPQKERGGA